MNKREPGKNKPSTANALKSAWKREQMSVASDLVSLKTYARNCAKEGDSNAKAWLHNKNVNTSNPPKGLGRTRRKKNR